jgi:hypothetical protein
MTSQGIDRVAALAANDDGIVGVAIISSPPWSKSATRTRSLDAVLAGPLDDLARSLGRTLTAAPSRYAFPRSGDALRSDDGGLVYDVRGRFEGETIVPSRPAPSAPKRGRAHDR